jgi:inorganic pyrophosphatase
MNINMNKKRNNKEELLEDYIEPTEEEKKEKKLDSILEDASIEFFGENIESEDEVMVFIEIGRNSNIKYEYDHKLKGLVCNRILSTPVKYFFNYGFIPNTLSDDGDALDCVVLIDEELVSGSYIKCKIIGCLNTEDNEGDDPKMIVVPVTKIDRTYENVNNLSDIDELKKEKIIHFFSHYKDLEKNKFVNVKGFVDKDEAIEIYKKSKLES